MRTAFWFAMLFGVMCPVAALAAESKPLNELPHDVVQWSTLWMELPKEMYAVGQDEGPVSALTWGPVRGTLMVIDATSKVLWDAAKEGKDGKAIFRYEF